jgi:hypothetical protein
MPFGDFLMSDTQTETKTKKQATAIRDWIKADGTPVGPGEENQATGFRYTHLATAKRLMPDFNPESDNPPNGSFFDVALGEAGKTITMLAIFGGLTLAGNVVNTATNGPKGDPDADVIALITERFGELDNGVWADRAGGVGGVRYNKDLLAQAIATAKGEKDPSPYLVKMENKVDPKTGAVVAADTKGAISYGAYAIRNASVKTAYDALTGGGVSLDSI